MLAAATHCKCHDQVERNCCGEQHPVKDALVGGGAVCRFADLVNKADVATERFYFLLLYGGWALCHRCLEDGFGASITLFYNYVPGAGFGSFVSLFARVEPGVGDFGNGEFALLFGVQEHADVLGGNHLVADDLLVDFVFGWHRAEFAEVGELGVGNGARQAVTLDVDGERHRFADF